MVKRTPMVAPFHQVKIDFSTGAPLAAVDGSYRVGARHRPATVGAPHRRVPAPYVGDRVSRGRNIYCRPLATQPSLAMPYERPLRYPMRLDRRFSAAPLPFAPEIRWVERVAELAEVAAPPAWTTARVEAWLDWADSPPLDGP